MSELLLRVEQVQRLLNLSRWTVYEMIHRGELPVLRVGRLMRVPRPALEAWIETNTKRAKSDQHEAA